MKKLSHWILVLVILSTALTGCASSGTDRVRKAAEGLVVGLDAARMDAIKYAANDFTAKQKSAACDAACKAAARTRILRVTELNAEFSRVHADLSNVVLSWDALADPASRFQAILKLVQESLIILDRESGTTHTELATATLKE